MLIISQFRFVKVVWIFCFVLGENSADFILFLLNLIILR